jgi:hypothetical protein
MRVKIPMGMQYCLNVAQYMRSQGRVAGPVYTFLIENGYQLMSKVMPEIRQKVKKILPAAEFASDTLSLTVSGQYPFWLANGVPRTRLCRYFSFTNFMQTQPKEPRNAIPAAMAPHNNNPGAR